MDENKTILICGATGFIGRNLLDFYHKQGKYKIKATYFKRPIVGGYDNVEWIKCDLRDPEQVRTAVNGVDIILQFAATTTGAKDIISKPYIHVTDNAVMNSLLLREAFEQGVENFIFPSCTIMYQKSETAIKESDFNPSEEIQSFYFGAGYTKTYLEKMCEFYSRLGKTKHTVIRHSNIYGPHDKYDLEKSHVFGATITKVMTTQNGNVNVWGTGEEKRDLLYVGDLIDFIDIAINKQTSKYELFNVGLGKGIKIKDLVSKIIKHSGRGLEIVHDLSKPTVPTSLFLDCSLAKEKLNWEPKHTLDEGIIKTLDWYKNNMKDIAVIIQSRDRVEEFINTVNMLYSTCYDQENFDIIGVIDDDQIQLYSQVKDMYPHIIWLHPKHTPGSWVNLIEIQHEFIKNNNYYFIWAVCDDFSGVSKDWDFFIKAQKNKYPDDLFTIHSSNKKDIFAEETRKNAYINNDDNDINRIGLGIYYNCCERLPVSTKKWIELMSPITVNPKFCTQHELITASLVMLLKYHYGVNRLVTCDEFYWGELIDQGQSSICDREKNYLDLITNKYEELMPVIEKMYDEINKVK
jgi:GDP-L-fucose synthase